MKKIMLVIVIFMLTIIKVLAVENIKCEIVDYSITINNHVNKIDSSILSVNDSTYLPIREMSDLLDLYVVWDEATNTIEISDIGRTLKNSSSSIILNDKNISATITEFKLKIDGYEKKTKNNIIVIDGTSYLPLRELSELLGFKVEWNEATKNITIDKIVQQEKDDESLYPFCDGELWGYMDKYGDVKIEPKYQEAHDFSEGLAVVGILYNDDYFKENNLELLDTYIAYGYIDKSGRFVLPPIYYEAYDFSDGLAPVVMEKGYRNKDITNNNFFETMGFFSYVNTAGDVVISGDYPIAKSFNNGFAVVCTIEGEYGLLDKNGILQKTDCMLYDLIYGKYVSDKKVINTDLQIVFDGSEYEKIDYISDKFIVVINDGKKGLIDFDNNIILDCQYEDLGYSSEENLLTFRKNGKYGYMDLNGNVVIHPQYSYAWTFQDGIAVVWNEEICSIIDKEGKILVEDLGKGNNIDKIFSRDVIRIFDDDYNTKYIDSFGNVIEPTK